MKSKPKALDLFCKAGGSSFGLHLTLKNSKEKL